MSQPTIEEVERAVRSVLARGREPARARGGVEVGPRVFAGRLLSVRALEALGELGDEVAVSPATVITPLAKDALKKRGIRLRWISELERSATWRAGEWGFVCESRTTAVELLRRRLLGGHESWREVGERSRDAAAWVAGGVDRGAVVLTGEASVATWIASRVPGVRAASPWTPDGVARSIEHLGANLLVFEPASHPQSELFHMLRLFRGRGAPRTPESLTTLAESRKGEER